MHAMFALVFKVQWDASASVGANLFSRGNISFLLPYFLPEAWLDGCQYNESSGRKTGPSPQTRLFEKLKLESGKKVIWSSLGSLDPIC